MLLHTTTSIEAKDPTQPEGVKLRVASTDTNVIQLSGYDSKPYVCDDTVKLSGSVPFEHPGTTTLGVEVQGLRAEIPIEITGVPEPVDGSVPGMD
jgi:hypothetical protein